MKLIFNKSSIVFNKVDMMAILSEQYGHFNRSAFESFMSSIGGEKGSIWNKICLMYMPIFSDGTETEPLYFDVKSCSVVKPIASTDGCWERTNDANNTKVFGYKGVSTGGSQSVGIDISNMGLTTKNTCLFGTLTANPYPTSSCVWLQISTNSINDTFGIQQRSNEYCVYNFQNASAYLTTPKSTAGFSKTSSVVMYQENGLIGINGTFGSSQDTSSVAEANAQLFEMAGKMLPSTNTYGVIVTIQGIAKSLTHQEAEMLRIALDNLVIEMAK